MGKILIVVDMQNDFVTGSLGTQQAQDIVEYAAEKICAAKKEGAHIICTMDTHREGYLRTMEGRNLPVEHCILGTDGWNLNDRILAALGTNFTRRMEEAGKEEHPENGGNDFVLFRERGDGGGFSVIAKGQFGSPLICREAAGYIGDSACGNGAGVEIGIIGLCTDICVVANALILKTGFPEAEIIVDSRGCAGVTEEKHLAALEVMRSCQINVI